MAHGEEPVCKMQLAVAYGERAALTDFAAPACAVPKHDKAVALGDGRCLEASAFKKKGEDDATCPVL